MRIDASKFSIEETRFVFRTTPASEKGCLKDYMLPIFERGFALVASRSKDDGNFEQAAQLNEEILVALAGIRSRA